MMMEVVADHVLTHIARPEITSDTQRRQEAGALVDVLHAYVKQGRGRMSRQHDREPSPPGMLECYESNDV